ncbi:MAG: hypothetical protein K2H40_03260, partial [Lachnospiraceae bacterium]|nr:hypothetical protein [Lachnospiraceae bacterium]
MSRKIPEQEYRKTLSFRLKQWFDGTKDPFVDTVEMKPQKEVGRDENIDWKRKREKRQRIERIYDLAHNWEIRSFNGFYKIFSGVFCLFLVAMLLIAVSYLPSYGHPENPANNEVAKRYIESGLDETGAVNIVTGMILDYRAFDTLGESHVLFIATCTVLILLRKDRKKDEDGKDIEESDRAYEPKNDVILQTAARVLVPPIIIFGIYVILGGRLGQGGGFSGCV